MAIKHYVTDSSTNTISNNNVWVYGATGGNEVVEINSSVLGVQLDANIERINLAGNLNTYKFVFVAGTGTQIQTSTGSVVATIPSLNQSTTVAFADGSAALQQTGSSAFTLGGVAVPTTAAVLAPTLNTADKSTVSSSSNNGGTSTTVSKALTTTVDTLTGTSADETFTGIIDGTQGAVASTFTSLDSINGGGGSDTFNLNVLNGTGTANPGNPVTSLPAVTLAGIQTINIRSAVDFAGDLSVYADLATVNVTTGLETSLTAAATANVNVSGATDDITVNGGKTVTVTDSTAAKTITIGATTGAAGNVTVTDSNVGAAAIAVDGGKDVTLTLTGSAGSTIKVGDDASPIAPTGAVTVTSTNKAVTAATDETLSAITVKGGTTINVAQTATSTFAAADTTGATITQGDVTVVGKATTSVTVTQAKSTAETFAVTAAAGTTETASVKFGLLKSGDSLIIGGDADATLETGELKFTALKNLTASEVAQAFANLSNPDTQASGVAANGTYSIAGATDFFTTWTSSAASSDTVVFTSTTATTAGIDNLAFHLTNTSTASVAPTVTTTAGVNKATAVTGVLGAKNGTVLIDDAATATITTVTVDGYGNASQIGNATSLTKLANLSLSNSGSTGTAGETDASMSVDATGVASLNLTVNNINGIVNLDGAADSALKTLNLTTSGADSSFALTAAAITKLAISGDKAVTLSSGTFTALATLTVSGSVSATFDGDEADTLTSVDTSATTGTVTATIDATKATYSGGAGVDTVSLATGTALTKAINLGGGDDTLSFLNLNVTGSTAALAGGEGTDTLSMITATAANLDNSIQTFYTGFERLTISDNGVATIDLANLGFTNYVTTSGSTGLLTLSNLANNGTVVLTAAATTSITVGIKDALTGTADVLNTVLSSTGNLAANVLTAANVETINISTSDTETGTTPTKNVDTLILTADKATKVNVTGAQDLTLTMTGSTLVNTIDGSTLTGGLTVTSLNTASATTIKGGAGADNLTAATGTTADVLLGGAGNDVLTTNQGLNTLTGGEGSDTFVIGTASLNVNSYATITDFGVNDLIKLSGADTFKASKVTLGDTAVFQDYANAAVNDLDTTLNGGKDMAAWFQFAGNTYVVVDIRTTNSTTFINGEDFIVKLTGLVDLTNASFNDTIGTIALV